MEKNLKTTLIITAIILIYGAFSTFFRDTALIGNIGKLVGNTNIFLFGYFAYANILLLFYPLYKLYTDASVRRDIDFYLGWILLFIAASLLEALVVNPDNAGFFGTQVVLFLIPYIGKAGVWLFWLMILALSLVFIVDESFEWHSFLPQKSIKSPKKAFQKRSETNHFFNRAKRVFLYLWKLLTTNPFASPKLEDEMMPYIEEHEKPRQRKVEQQSKVKNIPPQKAFIEESSEIKDVIVEKPVTYNHESSKVTSVSGVQIVKISNFQNLNFYKKHPNKNER